MEKPEKALKTIRYQFSNEEQAANSKELAETCGQKKEIEDEKKAVMSSFKSKIDSHDARINLLSKWISSGYDYRSVECILKKNFKTGKREYYYQGVLVEEEPLRAEDHQLAIAD
jgi:hypothetical protein